MEITRLDATSVGKVVGLVYAGLGLVLGGIVTLVFLLGAVAGGVMSGMDGGMGGGMGGPHMGGALFGWLLGAGAVLVFPIVQGVIGFVTGALVAWIYNVVAPRWGGLVFDARERPTRGG